VSAAEGRLPPSVAALEAPVVAARRGRVLRRLLRNPGARIGLVLLGGLVVMALAAPWIAPYGPSESVFSEVLEGPSSAHLMGTDSLGRDIFSRVVYGSRITLRVGLIAVAAAFSIGTLIGVVSGFYGGRLDSLVMRLVDIGLAFPGILLALVVIAVLGPGLFNVMIALAIANVPLAIRVARGSALAAKRQLYVESAEAIGGGDATIMGRYILPAVIPPVVIVATIEVANAILIAAGLSFLGLGAQPPAPEWGAMLAQAQTQLQTAWWVAVFPGLAIVVAVLSINLVGDGLRDALDPKTRG
jgi:ABC-type dipeptide/oligopeptide/nickel transport system permease subunit